jgi:urease accessory protein UreH
MAASARLAWSDALMAGREGRGERWRFASLGHQLRVTRGTAVEYLERYRIAPAEAPVGAAWVAGGCCYFGTALTSGWPAEVGDAERLHLELAGMPGLHASADRLGAALTLVRLAATGGPAFHEARARIRRALDPPP